MVGDDSHTPEDYEEKLSEIKTVFQQKSVHEDFKYLYYNKEGQNDVKELEDYMWKTLILKREKVTQELDMGRGCATRPANKAVILRAYKNYTNGRMVLFSKIVSGKFKRCDMEEYMITNNYYKRIRFDEI